MNNDDTVVLKFLRDNHDKLKSSREIEHNLLLSNDRHLKNNKFYGIPAYKNEKLIPGEIKFII